MNIDDLKDIWENDNNIKTPEISLKQRNSLNLPLEKIRKNMRTEFWSSALLIVFLLVPIWWFDISLRYKLYIEMLLIAMALVSFFFYFKFFKLYKEINKPEIGTLSSLQDLLHQFNLNKQYYLSYYVSFVPFIVTEMIIITEFSPRYQHLSDLYFVIVFLSSVIFGLLFLFLLGKFWFQYYYGKHIKVVENLVKELKNDDNK